MVRKVPNLNAWVLKASDVNWFVPTSTIHVGFGYVANLPLFSVSPIFIKYRKCFYDDDELILLIDVYDLYINQGVFNAGVVRDFTLEEVEEINKIWNKFYESENKET